MFYLFLQKQKDNIVTMKILNVAILLTVERLIIIITPVHRPYQLGIIMGIGLLDIIHI